MKWVLLFLFNICAFYLLIIYVIGNGGIIDQLKKSEAIYDLEKQKLSRELEKEDLISKLNYLKELKFPDPAAIASFGKKKDNMVIFKFNENQKPEDGINIYKSDFIYFRIYFYTGLTMIMIIFGNIMLCVNYFRRRPV
jgi:hypothetical protein